MKSKTLFLILIFCSFGWKIGSAQQTGDPDTTFRISQNGVLNGTIYQVLVQPDQKVLALGNFTVIGNYLSPYLLRFHTDGRIDTTFRSPFLVGQLRFNLSYPYPQRNEASILNNGKILVSGDFDSAGSSPTKAIAILDPNGLIDTTFRAYTNALGGHEFHKQLSAIQGDSGFYYCSFFSNDDRCIFTRLLPNGRWDTSFHSIINVIQVFNVDYIWKISRLNNQKLLLHHFDPGCICPNDVPSHFYSTIHNYSGTKLIDRFSVTTGQPFANSEYLVEFRWFNSDSLNNIYSFINYHYHEMSEVSFVRINLDSISIHVFSFGNILEHSELMNFDELIASGQLLQDSSRILKILDIKTTPSEERIGIVNGKIHSITRNASNQAYLAGDFTQYNGQDSPKLVRIHNFKTITGLSSPVESTFSLSPNPSTSGRCVLQTNSGTEPAISITDHLGRKLPFSVSKASDYSYSLKLESQACNPGVYFVKVTDHQKVKTIKWLVSGEAEY